MRNCVETDFAITKPKREGKYSTFDRFVLLHHSYYDFFFA